MSDNWRRSEYRDMIMAKILYSKEPGYPTVKQIAFRMGKSESWIYSILRGDTSPAPEDLPLFYNATRDIEIISWFADRTEDLRVTRTPKPEELNGTIADEIIKAGSEHGALCQEWLNDISDGDLDNKEVTRLLRAIQTQENTLIKMRAEILKMMEA